MGYMIQHLLPKHWKRCLLPFLKLVREILNYYGLFSRTSTVFSKKNPEIFWASKNDKILCQQGSDPKKICYYLGWVSQLLNFIISKLAFPFPKEPWNSGKKDTVYATLGPIAISFQDASNSIGNIHLSHWYYCVSEIMFPVRYFCNCWWTCMV